MKPKAALIAAACLSLLRISELQGDKPSSVDDYLANLRKGLRPRGCRQAGFTQTYIPNGFATGRAQAGRMVISTPSRIRFEYEDPKGRMFALDGAQVTAIDPGTRSVTKRTMSNEERIRYPLFDIAVGARPLGFHLDVIAIDGSVRLEARPNRPTDDLVWGAVDLGKDGRNVRRVEWKDAEGNLNRFDLGELIPFDDCSSQTFRPASPEGFQVDEHPDSGRD